MGTQWLVIAVIFLLPSESQAFTVTSYKNIQEAAQNDQYLTDVLDAYHQGISETVASVLYAPPKNKFWLNKNVGICLSAEVVTSSLIEKAISNTLPQGTSSGIGGDSVVLHALIGLSAMAPCN